MGVSVESKRVSYVVCSKGLRRNIVTADLKYDSHPEINENLGLKPGEGRKLERATVASVLSAPRWFLFGSRMSRVQHQLFPRPLPNLRSKYQRDVPSHTHTSRTPQCVREADRFEEVDGPGCLT